MKTDIFEIAFEKGKNPAPLKQRREICSQLVEKIDQMNRRDMNIQGFISFISQLVNLIRDELGFYFVRLFILEEDRQGKIAIMYAGSGEIGPLMIERRHGFIDVAVPFVGIIDTAIGANKVVMGDPFTDGFMVSTLPQDMKLEPIHPLQFQGNIKGVPPDPLIPDAKVQMTLPLRAKEGIVGALCIYSCLPDSFSEQDISIFLPLTDYIAQLCTSLKGDMSFRDKQ
jgi:GAF domain-containing protein